LELNLTKYSSNVKFEAVISRGLNSEGLNCCKFNDLESEKLDSNLMFTVKE
jgi:hypothetical protein